MLEIQSQENVTKEAAYIYCQIFINYFFISKVNFLKNRIIIQHLSAEPEKVL
jgi:uncharacterized membrane protein YobD (UPF0266 family)